MKHGSSQTGKIPIFRERLVHLQGDMTITAFADKLGLSRQTVGFYINGDRIPDALTLMEIAKKCGVSTDYLLGMSDLKSPSASIRECVDRTGLTEDQMLFLSAWTSLTTLEEKQSHQTLSEIENHVLEQSKKIGSPRMAQRLCINFLRDIVYAVLERSDSILSEFSMYSLAVEDEQKFRYGRGPQNLTRAQFDDLANSGYTVVPSSVAARLSWERISSILERGLREAIIDQLSKGGAERHSQKKTSQNARR